MNYKKYKSEELSVLGMGNMRLPVQNGKPGAPIDRKRAQEIIDYGMKSGINYYDTAYVYHNGESEKFLGEAMRKYPRESYNLATKFLYQANPDYKAVFEEQLKRLETDYIDFYLLHAISDNTLQQYVDSGCIEYFLEQKEKGRIRYLGFSSHSSVETLTKLADHHKWDFAQIQLNYFDWIYGTAKAEYEVLEERNIPVIVMEPVRGGRLVELVPESEKLLKDAHPDWSIASWAFRFVKSLPQVQVVLSGMSNLEQITDNVETFSDKAEFTENDREILFKACDLFHKQVVVPCTECRYCCPDCPMEINIPQYLRFLNAYKLQGMWGLNDIEKVDSKGKPSDCIGCGSCSNHCPQNIPIPEFMRELAEAMEKRS